MEDKWLNDLRSRLSDFETEAPEGLWESLQEELMTSGSDAIPSKSRRAGIWHRRIAIAASIAAVLGTGTGVVLTIKETTTLQPTEIMIAARREDNSHKYSFNKPDNKELVARESTPNNKRYANNGFPIKPSTIGNPQEEITESDEVTPPINERSDTDTPYTETTDESHKDENTDNARMHSVREALPESYISRVSGKRYIKSSHSKGNDRCFLSITTSGIRSSSMDASRKIANPDFGLAVPSNTHPNNNHEMDNNDASNSNPYPDDSYGPEGNTDSDNHYPDVVDPDSDESTLVNPGPHPPVPNGEEFLDEHTDTHYYLPIRMAITIQYNLNNRFGIETGITYSRLLSKETVWSKSSYSVADQTLYYIGIPLNIKFSAWSWKCLNLYLSAGTVWEKCIYNEMLTTTYKEPETKRGRTLNGEKPFQWSVNAAAGVQIKLGSTVSIFAEPGVSYYFDDGSTLKTIYKDKPFNFNINTGLRFTFGNP